MGEPNKRQGSAFRGVGVAAALSVQLIAAIMVGFLLGHWLDGMFHTSPWLTVIGVFVGIVAGFWGLFQLSRMLSR